MNDLATLLDRAAGPATAPVDSRGDLSRGRHALSRTRRRLGALGLAGVAAAGVAGVGAVRLVQPDDVGPQHAVESKGTAAGISFLAQPMTAGPYTFDTTPAGWEVQGADSYHVTIAPVGFADQEPLSFVGKLVIMFDGNPPSGERVELDGRTFWVRAGEAYTTISTRTLPGEPPGVVLAQYPTDTGWDRASMLAFLASVHVGQGAQAGVG